MSRDAVRATPPRVEPPRVASLLDLSGQVAIVTGASRGIGAGIAVRLAEAGADVALVHRAATAAGAPRTGRTGAPSTDAPSTDAPGTGVPRTDAPGTDAPRTDAPGTAAATVAARITALGRSALVVTADVADPDAVDSMVRQVVAAFGRIDVLVNNAGLQPVSDLLEMSLEEWDAIHATNVRGAFLATRSVARQMIVQGHGGSIVDIASIEGLQPAFAHSHYAASKAALLMHARAAALELGPHGIRVNAVAPGLIRTETLGTDWPEGVARWLAAVPLGRLGEPEDVADACLFLCSPAARWITGATLVVDGGVLTHPTY